MTGSSSDSSGLEDELTVYSTTVYEPVLEIFAEEYGVTVTESVYTGPEVMGRFTTEAETGELQADMTIQSLSALSWSESTSTWPTRRRPTKTA